MPKRQRPSEIETDSLPPPSKRPLTEANLQAHKRHQPTSRSHQSVQEWNTIPSRRLSQVLACQPVSSTSSKSRMPSSQREARTNSSSSKRASQSTGGARSSSRTSRQQTDSTASSFGPRDASFEQALEESNVYPVQKSMRPANFDEIAGLLQKPRASMSPTPSAYALFTRANDYAITEDDVKANVMPSLRGSTAYHGSMNLIWNNLDTMTGADSDPISKAKPDYYDGAAPEDLNWAARKALASSILPNKANAPILPNHASEVKGRGGNLEVAKRQVQHAGALGARAMQSIQSYTAGQPVFDNNARTLTNTYHSESATFYAHHVTAPTTAGGRPHYHMTRVAGTNPIASLQGFKDTARYMRNSRDVAAFYRAAAIGASNLSQTPTSNQTCLPPPGPQRYNSSSQPRTDRGNEARTPQTTGDHSETTQRLRRASRKAPIQRQSSLTAANRPPTRMVTRSMRAAAAARSDDSDDDEAVDDTSGTETSDDDD